MNELEITKKIAAAIETHYQFDSKTSLELAIQIRKNEIIEYKLSEIADKLSRLNY